MQTVNVPVTEVRSSEPGLTLEDKMKLWRDLQARANQLAEEIRAEVLRLGKTVETDGAIARFSKGRGRYDYESVAKELEPDEEVVLQYSTIKVDWRKVVTHVGAPKALLDKYYTPGSPTVSLKLARQD